MVLIHDQDLAKCVRCMCFMFIVTSNARRKALKPLYRFAIEWGVKMVAYQFSEWHYHYCNSGIGCSVGIDQESFCICQHITPRRPT